MQLIRLKEVREEKNMTQESLARTSGVSIRTVARLEGGGACHNRTANDLARALKCKPSDLEGTNV